MVSFAADEAVRIAAFALSGRLFVADLADLDGTPVRELVVPGPVLDPRPDPTGAHIGYVADGALRVIDADGADDRALAVPEAENVTYGLAEFVAAEEMNRTRGFWWSPDGRQLLVARVDTTPVARWHVSDPAHPDRPPVEVAYPSAGTANADVSVVLAGLDGNLTPVGWDSSDAPYLTAAHWSRGGPRCCRWPRATSGRCGCWPWPRTARVELICEDTDPDWVDVVVGTPAWTPGGELVRVVARDGAYRLMIGEDPVTPVGLNVAAVLDVGDDVLFTRHRGGPGRAARLHQRVRTAPSSVTREPGRARGGPARGPRGHVIPVARLVRLSGAGLAGRRADRGDRVARGDPGAHAGGDVPNRRRARAAVRAAAAARAPARLGAGCRCCATPTAAPPPGAWSASRNAYLTPQWFADQGFAVLIADGRGTPGRGPDLGPANPLRRGHAQPRGPSGGATRGRREPTPTWT